MASESSVAGAGAGEKQVIVVGIDEGEHSEYALEWTLDHFFADSRSRPPVFSLVVVYARPFPTSVVGMGSPGVADVLPFVEDNLRTIAAGVAERAKQLCESRSVKSFSLPSLHLPPLLISCVLIRFIASLSSVLF